MISINVSLIAIAFLTTLMLVSCGSEGSKPNKQVVEPILPNTPADMGAPSKNKPNIAKVKVLADGTILLNDKKVTIDDLNIAFNKLKNKNGVVWYYRENAEGQPPPQSMAVIKTVVEAKLPIKLSTKPDFSDSIGLNGK